jgi:two-component system response regulator AdeR
MQPNPFVVVIEDVEAIAEIYAEMFAFEGISVEIIPDGAVALQRLAMEAPDLILLDIHLPKVSGVDILAFVRDRSHLKRTKVVVITADALLAQDTKDAADLTLIKPVSAMQIRDLSMQMLI